MLLLPTSNGGGALLEYLVFVARPTLAICTVLFQIALSVIIVYHAIGFVKGTQATAVVAVKTGGARMGSDCRYRTAQAQLTPLETRHALNVWLTGVVQTIT